MPSVCRRIVVLLCAALLSMGALPLSAAHAQGAGDQQYSDPFGDSDSGSSNSDDNSGSGSNSGSSGSSSDDDVQPLTPAPQTSGGSSGSGSSSGTAGTSSSGTSGAGTTTAAPAATLPNTGLDTRVLLIGGAVLLLLGVGLRLRNAPERF